MTRLDLGAAAIGRAPGARRSPVPAVLLIDGTAYQIDDPSLKNFLRNMIATSYAGLPAAEPAEARRSWRDCFGGGGR